jgi:hypothetical protein
MRREGMSRQQPAARASRLALWLGVPLGIILVHAGPAPVPALAWQTLQPGVEYAAVNITTAVDFGDKKLQVVRVDPARAKLVARLAAEGNKQNRTAGEWCRDSKLAVAINLGMFQEDRLSNVGYLRHRGQVNNPKWSATYQAAFGFDPQASGLAPAVMADLDQPEAQARLAPYRTVVQNLRLIKGEGKNAWSVSDKRWSEAALALDAQGRVLFLFCRSPFSMWEFNRMLLSLPLGIVRAMHLEGGPEASLSIHTGGVNLDLCGSYETGYLPKDTNPKQWAIPNVLGVAK